MHEVSIAQSIVQLMSEVKPAETPGYISAVNIRVGELSAIETDALLFAFDIVKAKTLLSRAMLNIEIAEGRAICNSCGTEFPMHHFATSCPNCGSYQVSITEGKEMKVVSYDLEDS